ncbi:hypothetical protein NQ317_009609 [Molorchus minor]|uniref:RING-type E3 ubiquitin transferase (cysteine targeting) n=1 Tax=Molorchus minor TaxID=1323400 RepID=A0ABQ9JTM5_9CUCU|nr:hypothetical protein NQ317_009609 [Molorchus minor]
MNANYLDKEIYKSLYQLVQEACQYLPPGITAPYEPELKLLLQVAILKYSVLHSGNTFGQELLSIKYDNISYIKQILYAIANCLSYIKDKLELWRPSHDINNTIFKIYAVLKMLDLINLSVFLSNGVKPLLIERILGLTQTISGDSFHFYHLDTFSLIKVSTGLFNIVTKPTAECCNNSWALWTTP